MSDVLMVLDAYVDAARTLCERPSVVAAVQFWSAERQAKKVAGNIPWDVVRLLLLERHGCRVLATMSHAGQLRALHLAVPGSKPARPVGATSTLPAHRRHDRVPIPTR